MGKAQRDALTALADSLTRNLPDALPYLLSRGISQEVAVMFGLGYVTEGDYAGRLSIPYRTQDGVVALKYRCANTDHGDHKNRELGCTKYLAEPGSGVHLFNAQALTKAERAVLTEGELDAVCVQAYCGIPAVGYPGTETWQTQPHFPLCFEGIPEVAVVSDGDEQGRRAAGRVAKSIGSNARVVPMPEGEDANSWMLRHGAAAFLELITQ